MANLLPSASVGRQSEGPDGGFQLLLRRDRVAAITAGHGSDLDVELLRLLIVKVRITGVEVVLLFFGAAFKERRESRRKKLRPQQRAGNDSIGF